MNLRGFQVAAIAAAAAIGGGCDQLGLGPHRAASAPPAPAAAPLQGDPDIRAHAGESYSDFVAAVAQYGPDALGFTAGDRARLWRAMASSTPGQIVTGGGAEALVFRGCAETGCQDGAATVAVETTTGSVFAGVRDVGGAEVLAPNDRVEALLRLNSPTRSWEGSVAIAPEAAAP